MDEPKLFMITLCMLVKNEEDNIVRCLTSAKDYVDEIIVLDTGSSDWTPLLAMELGAIVRFGKWENNFSKARNQNKQSARGEWILFLDADEELPPETGRALRGLACRPEVEAYIFSIINNTSAEENSPQVISSGVRMFRNKPAYLFEGALHEQIKSAILRFNPNSVILHSGLAILHYGYSNDNPVRKQKTLRNISILEGMVAENPADGFNHYNLGVSYYVNGQLEDAAKHFQLSKQHTCRTASYLPALYRNYAVCLNDAGEFEAALNLIEEGLSYFPDYPDLYYLQGQIYTTLNLFSQARNCFVRCLNFTRINHNYITTRGVESYLPYEQLADIFFQQQDWKNALEHQLRAISAGATSYTAALRLAKMAGKLYTGVNEILALIHDNLPQLSQVDLLRLLFELGYYREVSKKVGGLPGALPEVFLLAARSCMYLGDWRKARYFIDKITPSAGEYDQARELGAICCILGRSPGDAQQYINSMGKDRQVIAEACQCILQFLQGHKQYLVVNFSTPLLDFFYHLAAYNPGQTVTIMENCLLSENIPGLFYQLGKLAFCRGQFTLTREFFLQALSRGYRASEIYRLLGKVFSLQGREWDGMYLFYQAVVKQPSDPENYCSLLKCMADIFENFFRELLAVNPDHDFVRRHILSLASLKSKLAGKEELICRF